MTTNETFMFNQYIQILYVLRHLNLFSSCSLSNSRHCLFSEINSVLTHKVIIFSALSTVTRVRLGLKAASRPLRTDCLARPQPRPTSCTR